jgi:hypothetical protein
MPSGREFIFERVYEGQRVPFHTFVAPGNANYAVIDDDTDHVHITIGTSEELEQLGLVTPKPKAAAPKKSTAKKGS